MREPGGGRGVSALRLFLADADATAALARVLAASQPASAVVFLRGDLGAGKSTLAREWLRALGVDGAIRSPTYTLVEHYPLAGGGKAVHLDLYRIGDAGELEFLALDDAEASLWLVEWPERGARALPPPDLVLELGLDHEGRSAGLSGGTAKGREWLDRLEQNGQLRAFPESAPEEGSAGHG
jgi:tRNA threonylcarbamoyladenosine biosynthesis protein TsaE